MNINTNGKPNIIPKGKPTIKQPSLVDSIFLPTSKIQKRKNGNNMIDISKTKPRKKRKENVFFQTCQLYRFRKCYVS